MKATMRIFLLCSLAVVCFAIPNKFTTNDFQPYIVNGNEAKIEEFPFIVSLQHIVNETHSLHSCAGSILNQYWVLTVRKALTN